MYEPDGHETVVRFTDPDGLVLNLSVDDEDYARLVHSGWRVVEELHTITREVVTPEDFDRARDGA